MDKEQYLSVYRHSLAHILAKAVIELYGKDVQYAIGPEVEDGCYYDFVFPRPVTEENFKEIEDKMREIIRRRSSPGRRRSSFLRISALRRRSSRICRRTPSSAPIIQGMTSWISAAAHMWRIPRNF